MLYKLLGITFWNSITSFINFVSNYLIIRWLGISIFGDFAVYNAYVAVGTLIFSVIPSNYSIFKYQDDKAFKPILYFFFIAATIGFSVYLLALNLLGFISINFFVSLLFSLPLGLQGYFDITLQATNNLKKYFFILFLIAISKVILLYVAQKTGHLLLFEQLVFFYAIPQAIIIAYLMVHESRKIVQRNFLISLASLTNFIRTNYKKFSGYYLNTFLKRIHENTILLLFQHIVSKETIGLFSLFVKLDIFVLSQIRTIEAFLYNRSNLSQYFNTLNKNSTKLIVFAQIIYLLVGFFYMKIYTGMYFWGEVFMMSFSCIFYYKFILSRSILISKYKNALLNQSSVVFILLAFLGFCIGQYSRIGANYPFHLILLTYFISFQFFLGYTVLKQKTQTQNDF